MRDCACGHRHDVSTLPAGANVEGNVEVSILGKPGAVLVPRLYIAFHGLRAVDLEALAEHYGWTTVVP